MGKKNKRAAAPVKPKAPAKPYIDVHSPSEFQKNVLDADLPVIVDFWADWCAPCKAMAPAFEAVAEKYRDRAIFAKVDTQKNAQVAQAFKIRSIPTLIVFYEGELFDIRVGMSKPEKIEQMIRRAMDKHEGVGVVGKLKRLFGREEDAGSAESESPVESA